MDPPDGFDPNQRYWRRPDGKLYPYGALPDNFGASENQESSSASHPPTQGSAHAPGASQPPTQVPRHGPPWPRPVFQPSHLHPSSSQVQAPFIPPPSSSQPPVPFVPRPPSSQAQAPFIPPPSSLFHPVPQQPSAPLPAKSPDPYARYFDPPSSSPSPELPEMMPTSSSSKTRRSEPATKPDKGKKRATTDAEPTPAKRTKVAPSKATTASKGKAPAKSNPSHTGRQPGSQNYSDDDVTALLRIVRAVLPAGGSMWAKVHERFNSWAQRNERPTRGQKPLKGKFEQLVRTPKPTGSGEIPPDVAEALEIDRLINNKLHVRQVDDEDVDGDDGEDVDEVIEVEDSDGEKEDAAPPSKKKSGPVLKAFRDTPTSSSSTRPSSSTSRRAQAEQFMTAVTTSLDPSLREARDEARFARRAMQDESARLVQENRDLQARVQSLNDRTTQLLTDNMRLQSRIELLETIGAFRGTNDAMPARSRGHGWDFEDPYRSHHAFPPPPFYPSHFSPHQAPSTPYMRSSSSHFHSYSRPPSWSNRGVDSRPNTPPLSPAWERPMSPPSPSHGRYGLGYEGGRRGEGRGKGRGEGRGGEGLGQGLDMGTSLSMAGPSSVSRSVPSSSSPGHGPSSSSLSSAAGTSSSVAGASSSTAAASSSASGAFSSSSSRTVESSSVTVTITTPSRRHHRRHSSSSIDGEHLPSTD